MEDTIGNKIYALRKKRDMSLAELAEATNSSKSYLCDVENNKIKNPSVMKLQAIAKVLNVSITRLIN